MNILILFPFLLLATWTHQTTTNQFLPANSPRPHVKPNPRIIGGDETKPHSLPFQVGVRINEVNFCGGSLISQNFVLTAAHCLIQAGSNLDVILGAHKIFIPEPSQFVLKAKKVIIHEQFNLNSYRHDLGLIQLSEAVPLSVNIQPIKLAVSSDSQDGSETLYADEIATVSGWGLTADKTDFSSVLRSLDVAVVNTTFCSAYFNDDVEYVTTKHLCTNGYRNRGSCKGDSGGPLTLNGSLIGVSSFNTELCEMCTPSVHTRVVEYLDWIGRNTDVELLLE